MTTLPDDLTLVLPDHGRRSTDADSSDWEPVDGTDSWLMAPCDAQETSGYPTDPQRSAAVAIIHTGPEYAVAEQIALFPGDSAAIRTMRDLRRSLVACADERTDLTTGRWYTDSFWRFKDAREITSSPDLTADEAFQAWNWNHTFNRHGQQTYGLGGGYFTVARVGNAVVLTMSDGETDWTRPGAVRSASRPEAKTIRSVLPYLCARYVGANGCTASR